MRPITSTIDFAEALRTIVDAARPIERTESLPLLDADGRVVARDVRATGDVPPFDRAAMDGYAVIAGETTGASASAPRTLRCVDRVFSGHVPTRGLAAGECMEIATGAPMPAGADAVVMVEDTTRDGDTVRFHAGVTARQNVGRRAADLAAGDTVVATGQVLTPSRIGALAATGVTRVEVFARPTVALLSTGDEIVQPGTPLRPDRSTTSIASRSRRSSRVTAAARSRCRRSATRSTRWSSGSIRRERKISWSFPAAARWAIEI